MTLKIGVISDIHHGPRAWFQGELRKITDQALPLTQRFINDMNTRFQPHLNLNLGDVIQDEGDNLDLKRYHAVLDLLDQLHAPSLLAAGNHDLIHLRHDQLLPRWRRLPLLRDLPTLQSGHLYYTTRLHGWDLLVLHTHERKDHYIWMDLAQLQWIEHTLSTLQGPVLVLTHHSLADQDTAGNHWFKNHPHLALVRERAHLRDLFERSGKVRAVLNGHLHWNNLTLHNGIPYITLPSPIENMTGDEQPCAAWSSILLDHDGVQVQVGGLIATQHRVPFPAT